MTVNNTKILLTITLERFFLWLVAQQQHNNNDDKKLVENLFYHAPPGNLTIQNLQ